MTGTGLEDYFSAGFYFKGAPFCTPTHGCTARSLLLARASAYRFHTDDPIAFEESLDFTLDHGLHNTMAADCTMVAYWYQREPHDAYPPLPPADQRGLAFPWKNLVQVMLCVGIPLVVVAGVLGMVFVWLWR
ncbi:MAG: DUF2961 domain-containing protein [Polyangiaceae bacterium]